MKRGGKHNVTIIIWCFLAVLLTSCTNYYVDNGRVLPKHPDYHLKDMLEPEAAASVLDSNAIYVFQDTLYPDGRILYFYYRFWEDGHVYQSAGLFTPPTRKDAESFYQRMVGYYTLEGQTLLIELFTYNPGTFGGIYILIEAEILGEDIQIKKSYSRDAPQLGSFDENELYRKVETGLLRGIPDW